MEPRRVEIRIFGMTCDECVLTVRKGIEEVPGVVRADVLLKDGKAQVYIDPDMVRPEEILRARVFRQPYRYRAIVTER